ncbi:short-chain dehydrogenase-like protein [Tricladium varicosporioides]|nr:short-chain dehydrogenase-like protein [Hymenoscyphus varicosporioides]
MIHLRVYFCNTEGSRNPLHSIQFAELIDFDLSPPNSVATTMASYLITGSSRGLGFALVAQLASLPPTQASVIFATTRSDAPQLNELAKTHPGRVIVVKLDATNLASIKEAVVEVEKSLNDKGLDVLINNAAIMGFTPDGMTTMEDLEDHFHANVISVHNVTRSFLPLLQKGTQKKIVNISSTVGSIAKSLNYALVPCPAYKISKAALNMLTVQYSLAYEKDGFTIFAINPGWLQTDLGGANADLPTEVGAKATLEKIIAAEKEHTGQFLNILIKGREQTEWFNQYDGLNAPW